MTANHQREAFNLAAQIAEYTPEQIYGPPTRLMRSAADATDPQTVGSADIAGPVGSFDHEHLPWNRTQPQINDQHSGTGAAASRGLVENRSSGGPTNPRARHRRGTTHDLGVPGSRRLTNVLLATIAVLLAGGLVVALAHFRTTTTVQPIGPPGPSSAGTTASPLAPGAALRDCSAELGAGAWCPTKPQCWSSVFSYMDAPYETVASSCERPHVYETFAVTTVSGEIARQSALEREPAVTSVCSVATLRKRLAAADRSWEVLAVADTTAGPGPHLIRCFAGRGDRATPLPFQ